MKTYVDYPPRKLQSEMYSGPITIAEYQHSESVEKMLHGEASPCRCRRATDIG